MSSEASETQKRYMRAALIGHQVRSTNVEIPVEVDGYYRSIYGHSTTIMGIGSLGVILFSEDSTPQEAKVHPEAWSEFETAARRLAQNNLEFYTILHPDWALPALLWTRKYAEL